jgi:hypothetical protein
MAIHYFDDPTPIEAEPKPNLFSIGTAFKFIMNNGQIKSVRTIPVQFA